MSTTCTPTKKTVVATATVPTDDNTSTAEMVVEQKKKRNLMTETLDMSISNARCQSHMKASLIPTDIEIELTKKRAALKAAKEVAKAAGGNLDNENIVSLKREIDEITELVVRVGGDAPIAMAAITDVITKECLKHAMNQTIAAGQKMVDIGALHSGDLLTVSVWPLICDLDAVKNFNPEDEVIRRQERAAANKAQKAAREAAKKTRETGETVPALADAMASSKIDDSEDHYGPTTTFHTYVDNATKVVKQEAAYSMMRVSQRLREVISDIVAEFVARFSRVAKVNILELLGVRTLNAGHLKAIVKSVYVLKSGREDDNNMQAILDYITEKVKLYHGHLKAERTRKWENMDLAKKTELEAKKASDAEAKKKRRAENITKRAIEMAKLAKSLSAEIGGK